MEESSGLTRCHSCMSKNDEKRLQTYPIRNGPLKTIFQMDQLTLCFICKRVAQQAEQFIYNVESNQILFQNITELEFDNVRSNINQLVNLTTLLPSEEDIIALSGKDDVPTASSSHMKIEVEVLPEQGIKKESQDESKAANNADDSDDLGSYEEVISSEVDSSDDDDEECNITYRPRMRRQYNKQNSQLRGFKIKKITISKAKLLEERAALAKDPRYMEAMYKCTDCIKWFVVKSSHDKHMELHKESNGRHECDICKQRLASVEQFNGHYSRHFTRFQCSRCSHTRKCKAVVKAHFLLKHCGGIKEFRCPVCGKDYGTRTSLHKHTQMTHVRTEKVKCEFCDKKYVDKSVLWSHLITHHAEQIKADVKKPTCVKCGRTFVTKATLKDHCCNPAEKKFYCIECDKRFPTARKLQAHLKQTSAHIRSEDLRHECPYCSRRFLNKRDIDRHVNGVHLHLKTFQCRFCDKAFAENKNLQFHIRKIHEGYTMPKKHSCPICDKLYQEKRSLEAHMRSHTGEKPYQCSQCAAQFSHSGSLHNHVKLVHLHMSRNRNKKDTAKKPRMPLDLGANRPPEVPQPRMDNLNLNLQPRIQDLGQPRMPMDLGQARMPMDLGQARMPMDLGHARMPMDLEASRDPGRPIWEGLHQGPMGS